MKKSLKDASLASLGLVLSQTSNVKASSFFHILMYQVSCSLSKNSVFTSRKGKVKTLSSNRGLNFDPGRTGIFTPF